jgi:membrane peptidoglycan carboxypeptidase
MIDWKLRLHVGGPLGSWSGLRIREFQAISESHPHAVKWAAILMLAVVPLLYEMRTSAFSSRILSSYARKLSYNMGPGPSASIVFPKRGPFDIQAGYTLIPDFERRLRATGYHTTQQARFSRELERAAQWGILPPYAEPTSTRLTIHGEDGQQLFQAPVGGYYFNSFEEIPPLAIKSLLIIENRELDEPADSRSNPVVDWNRLAKAAILYSGHKLGLPLPVEGGSTLATQIEKYRHSYDGRTDSMLAKFRQMTGASLKVYQNGPDTREERREIILNYMNSIPLSAAPGYGEIHGIGSGLNAWFDLNLQDVKKAFSLPDDNPEKARAFKHTLALFCSVKAPTHYLLQHHDALEARVNFYTQLLANIQAIPQDFAKRVKSLHISFSSHPPKYPVPLYAENKAINDIRSKLASLLGMPGFYELDRLHLDVDSTINPELQQSVADIFQKLHDPHFIDTAGLRGERLLAKGDPSKVVYGMMLFEKTPGGNLLRVVTDNLNSPFDINTGMKMQLGSTAKLRTLANYLSIVAGLYDQFSIMDASKLQQQEILSRDPITLWALEIMKQDTKPDLDSFLQRALDRKYSANPGESFFTGGGIHNFHNFEKSDNGRILTVREATQRSVNLVYIRLMRDLVRYYEARLPYTADSVLSESNSPIRHRMLQEIADEESKHFLFQAYKSFQNRTPETMASELLGDKAKSPRHQAILFYAWHHGADKQALTQWMEKHLGRVSAEQISGLMKAYNNPRITLSDYGYLLGIHPLTLWCAGELARAPQLTWEQLWDKSGDARQITAAWLFKTRNRSAQDLRLRIRFEQDAFTRMTPLWKRLGFPFARLAPSYATAIGSSGDRPEALAHLMGILLNDGMLKPTIRMSSLRFADKTPYETVMEPIETEGTRVLPSAITHAILPVLAQVVQSGTAVRLAGAFKIGNRALIVGGKTGSGDNRFDAIGYRGQIISSRPVDRTAVFVFYIEDRYFGVITAFIPGKDAGEYGFTSSLPVAILKLLAPNIESLWLRPTPAPQKNLIAASNSPAETLCHNSNGALPAAKSGSMLAIESFAKQSAAP